MNPRASRTVPYLSKATGVPLAKVAARVATPPESDSITVGLWRFDERGGNHMTVKFYLLGCAHEYEERNDLAGERKTLLYRCEHLYECKNCGHWYIVDSSD